MTRRSTGAVLALALLCGSSSAFAETPPSMWERTKRPETADEFQLHLTAQRVLQQFRERMDGLPESLNMLRQGQLMGLLAMLQGAGAEKSDNPLLRFDLADVFGEMGNYPRAAELYKSAMRDFPEHPLRRRSRFELAIACGHIGDHECEARMYREIIAQSTSPAETATPTLNLAETDMHARDLREAIAGYREVYRLAGHYPADYKTPALALWGLAVALDRSGETREAEESAYKAVTMAMNDVKLLESNGVFFYPDYEVHWYEAITYAAIAKHVTNPRQRLGSWLLAEREMTLWIKGAEKKKDYWLPIAKSRLATYEKERKRADVPGAQLDGPAEPPSRGAAPGVMTPPARIVPNPKPAPRPPSSRGDVTL